MKWFSSIFLATVILVPSSAQLRESLVAKDQLDATTVILRSANNVDKAIAQFSVELNADQPDCFDNDYNCKLLYRCMNEVSIIIFLTQSFLDIRYQVLRSS